MRKSDKPGTRTATPLHETLGYMDEETFFNLIGVKTGTGRNRQSAGSLPAHYKVGRKKLYKIVEVEQWIARRRVARCS